jgi:hypothetical protein
LVSMDEPDSITPRIVRYLVEQDLEVVRVAEVEHTLERAYLDLVSRPPEGAELDGVDNAEVAA